MPTSAAKPPLPAGLFRAGDLPAKMRPGIAPGAVVRVHVTQVQTENGFTPEEEQEILRAEREDEVYGPFETTEEAIAYLHRCVDGTDGPV